MAATLEHDHQQVLGREGASGEACAVGKLPVVCHVVHSLNIGGAELLATRIAQRLSDRYRTVFACLDQAGPLAEQLEATGVPFVNVARRGGFDQACVARLRAWFAEQQVSLVHAHQYTPFAYALLTGLWGRRRPPVVFTEHGRFYPDKSSWKRKILHGCLLRKTDRVVGVGQAVRRALHAVERIDERRIDVIYNGIPLAAHAGAVAQRAELRQQQGASEDTFVCVQVARFDPIKNHALVIDAFGELVCEYPAAQLWLVGDGPERAACEARVAAADMQSKVKFLGERRDVPALMAAADVVTLTSHSEGIPLVLIEAMAAGKPVVATDVGGVAEVIQHKQHGLLQNTADASDFASSLLKLARLPDLRAVYGSAGQARAEQFSEENMVDAYDRLYAATLSATNR